MCISTVGVFFSNLSKLLLIQLNQQFHCIYLSTEHCKKIDHAKIVQSTQNENHARQVNANFKDLGLLSCSMSEQSMSSKKECTVQIDLSLFKPSSTMNLDVCCTQKLSILRITFIVSIFLSMTVLFKNECASWIQYCKIFHVFLIKD